MPNLKRVSLVEDHEDDRNRTSIPKKNFSSLRDSKELEIYVKAFDPNNTGPRFGKRHIQACLIFFCLTLGLSIRSCLSIAIVAMTDKDASPNPNVPTYEWKNTSVMLSSFFWGYMCLQVFAGYVGNTYGPNFFLLPAFAINSISSIKLFL